MLNERPPFYQPNLSRGSGLRLLRAECPKRKLNPIVHLNYPSPPMSIPPLSPKTPLDHSASPSRQPPVAAAATADRATTTTSTTSTTLPMPTATATSVAYSPSNYASRAQDLFAHPYHPTTPSHPSRSFHTFSTRQPPPISGPSSTAVSESSSTIPGPSPKGGRKPKAHVASACINCKRAHLSCDINRPCARCVSSGKQDSCFDVQHKKRGRPRLREDGDFRGERMVPERTSAAPAASVVPPTEGAPSSRSMAVPRPRRAESFRSLRSQDSDVPRQLGPPTYPYDPLRTAATTYMPAEYPRPASDSDVPTAYLDLDLIIIKANSSFCHMMQTHELDHAGRQLSEIAVPVDGVSFASIRALLRAERDHQAPAYMPPIVQAGQDFLEGVSLNDVDRCVLGHEDHTYTWRPSSAGGSSPVFPARVRLAKANAYFVAVTLPSPQPAFSHGLHTNPLRPHAHFMSPPLHPDAHPPEQYTYSRYQPSQSAPAGRYMPHPTTGPLPAPHRTPGHQPTRSYPPPQPHVPYQQQIERQPPPVERFSQSIRPQTSSGMPASVMVPRLPPAEPPTATTVFNPRSAPQESHPSHTYIQPTGVQLPPMLGAAPYPAGLHAHSVGATSAAATSSARTPDITKSTEASPDEGESATRTPRKRRKLDLGDVLHQD